MCVPCHVGGKYIRTSGTSMAAPMIAGLVADLLQAHPNWTPDMVKGALTSRFVAANPSLQEVDGLKASSLDWPTPADRGLTPNQLVDPATGNIDYARSSWSRSSWSTTPTAASDDKGVGSSRSSWSRSSWSTRFDPSSITG
jgi:subtilisin family serine protease